ncbi:unnamed protein product [Toxocara canis]|uniref:NTS domain-containing protein n=1 Tax=Toxocara canis TaxID=6265 RepID=A0A183V9N0_TOXCA|nr:unnamed protein product [Toxocara canis]
MTEEIKQKFGDFKENCFPKPSGGCRCNEKDQHGNDIVGIYDSDAECKVLLPSAVEVETAQKKHEVNEAIKHKFGDFKESCFPRPSGGCRCNEKDANGNEVVVSYDSEIECRADMTSSIEVRTAQNKKKVNEQIKQKYGAFKENCFPKPSGGCSCNEKDARGKDIVAKYNTDAECKIPMRSKRGGVQRPSQNVRDPVRERAQANYAAVVNELNEKFKGLKEGCFPRPKGIHVSHSVDIQVLMSCVKTLCFICLQWFDPSTFTTIHGITKRCFSDIRCSNRPSQRN